MSDTRIPWQDVDDETYELAMGPADLLTTADYKAICETEQMLIDEMVAKAEALGFTVGHAEINLTIKR